MQHVGIVTRPPVPEAGLGCKVVALKGINKYVNEGYIIKTPRKSSAGSRDTARDFPAAGGKELSFISKPLPDVHRCVKEIPYLPESAKRTVSEAGIYSVFKNPASERVWAYSHSQGGWKRCWYHCPITSTPFKEQLKRPEGSLSGRTPAHTSWIGYGDGKNRCFTDSKPAVLYPMEYVAGVTGIFATKDLPDRHTPPGAFLSAGQPTAIKRLSSEILMASSWSLMTKTVVICVALWILRISSVSAAQPGIHVGEACLAGHAAFLPGHGRWRRAAASAWQFTGFLSIKSRSEPDRRPGKPAQKAFWFESSALLWNFHRKRIFCFTLRWGRGA